MCHWTADTSYPILPREADNFPLGSKYPKHVPLSPYVAYSETNGISC